MIELKNVSQLDKMRTAGRIVAETLQLMKESVCDGITTGELDRIAEEYIRKCGALPGFKGLYGFPATLCTSVNEEVVHGIPGLRQLKSGDIISIDCGSLYKGYYGDATVSCGVGQICEEYQNLLKVCEQSLMIGIDQARIGNRLYDISHAVQTYVESNGMSVV
ncbi:MAG: type I methionyl aminopeptidase, partial [Eubacteriales bacterium]